MSTLEQRIAPMANLIAQLRELNQLRERVRKAELAGRLRRVGLYASGPGKEDWPGDHGGSGAEKEGSFGGLRRR
jgi:hypothetical protein